MKQTFSKKVVVGVLTQPSNESSDSEELLDQLILDPLKCFLEANNSAIVVPIRYDLADEPNTLLRTLSSLDGVLFPGGFLSIRFYETMPPKTRLFYRTAGEVLKFAMSHKLPLLGICQGFEVLNQLVVDMLEPANRAEDKLTEEPHHNRDSLLADIKYFSQLRTTKWTVDNPGDFALTKEVPSEVLQAMASLKMQRHAHNWAIPTEVFRSF